MISPTPPPSPSAIQGRSTSSRSRVEEAIHLLAEAGQRAAGVVKEEGAVREACELLLAASLAATGSDYGFCGKCMQDEAGQPYLFTLAMTNIAWNAETAKVYARFLSEGLAFRNLDTLFGNVMLTRKVVVTRDAPHDPRAGGVPPGHPALHRFLGIPILSGDRIIGEVGLANFDPALTDAELATIADLIALASVGSLALVTASEEADTFRRVRSLTRYDLLRRTVGGFAHEFNNELMCLRVGLPLLQPLSSQRGDDTEIWQEMDASLQRMTQVSQTLEKFAIMAHGSLSLDEVATLAQHLIRLLTMSECESEILGSVSGVVLSVPEQIAVSWLVEALTAALGPDLNDERASLKLTTQFRQENDAYVTFAVTGAFNLESSIDAMFTLEDECRSLALLTYPWVA